MADDSIGSIAWLARMLGDAWAPAPEAVADALVPVTTIGTPAMPPEALPARRVRRRRARRVSARAR